MSFKIGDTVQLKSGGPLMTVHAMDGAQATCVWFEKAERKEGVFSQETLELVNKPGPTRVGARKR